MSITKPFYRLWRPVKNYSPWGFMVGKQKSLASIDYLKDERFSCQAERESLVTAAHLIILDLYDLFNYIEPHDDNFNVYSHRIYELFLRTATEFEANCKGILKANGYKRDYKLLNIRDYFKIASTAKLSEYQISFERWSSNHTFIPFESWKSGKSTPLPWYQSYNAVKHDRFASFKEANLKNLMNAVAGLLCILHAQYGEEMQSACYEGLSLVQNSQNRLQAGSFTINAPCFSEEEQYDFLWVSLKREPNPIQKYNFQDTL